MPNSIYLTSERARSGPFNTALRVWADCARSASLRSPASNILAASRSSASSSFSKAAASCTLCIAARTLPHPSAEKKSLRCIPPPCCPSFASLSEGTCSCLFLPCSCCDPAADGNANVLLVFPLLRLLSAGARLGAAGARHEDAAAWLRSLADASALSADDSLLMSSTASLAGTWSFCEDADLGSVVDHSAAATSCAWPRLLRRASTSPTNMPDLETCVSPVLFVSAASCCAGGFA